MATPHKGAKLRDRQPTNNNAEDLQLLGKEEAFDSQEQSSSKRAKPQRDIVMFGSNVLDSREVEVEQFSISAHSSDSEGAFKGKGRGFACIADCGVEDNEDEEGVFECKDDEYSINAEESKSEEQSHSSGHKRSSGE